MKPILGALVLLFVACVSVSTAWELVLYDNFNAKYINLERWFAEQLQSGDGVGLELIREIEAKRLRLSHRVYGGMSSDDGSHVSSNALFFAGLADPDKITEIKFDLAVKKVEVSSCTVNGHASIVNARASAFLFSDGSGNIVASIGLEQFADSGDPPHVLRVVGLLNHTGMGVIGSVDLGTVATDTVVTLRMKWRPELNQVDFQRNAETVQAIAYTADDSQPPNGTLKLLEVIGFAANCTAAPRPVAFMRAVFNNVFINASAVQ